MQKTWIQNHISRYLGNDINTEQEHIECEDSAVSGEEVSEKLDNKDDQLLESQNIKENSLSVINQNNIPTEASMTPPSYSESSLERAMTNKQESDNDSCQESPTITKLGENGSNLATELAEAMLEDLSVEEDSLTKVDNPVKDEGSTLGSGGQEEHSPELNKEKETQEPHDDIEKGEDRFTEEQKHNG